LTGQPRCTDNGWFQLGAVARAHVDCCDRSPGRHYHATQHPIIEGYDPRVGWGWCYVDEVTFDLSDRKTPRNGPIPRYY
jgi:hypothetical protein